MRPWLFLPLAAALAAEAQTGEVTSREVAPTFRASVNLVRVPVVVRDKQGHTVGTLRKEDFLVTDRGKTQYVSQFALEGSAVPKPPAPRQPAEGPEGLPLATSKLVVPTRFVAFVFDDIHLKMADLMNVRLAAIKHIEQGIPSANRVAVLTMSGKVSLAFTGDLARFRQALMKIMPVPPHETFPPASYYVADQWMNRDDNQALQMQVGVTAACLPGAPAGDIAKSTLREAANDGFSQGIGAFRVLDSIVRLLSAMPGERIIILASPGMYVPDELEKDLTETIDRATKAGVVINTLDGRGVYTAEPAPDIPGCHLLDPQTQLLYTRYDNWANLAQGEILHNLADSTGGTAISDNDFAGGFDRLSRPPEYIYYLGFYPAALKPDGKFHEIKVKLAAGKGLTVQARKGYWAPSREEDAAATATREIGEAVFSRDELRDLPLDVHTQFFKTSEADAKLKITAHFDIRQLPFRKADDRNRDDVTMVCALFDANGNFVKGTQKIVELRLKDENLERHRASGITVNTDFDVKVGPYMVRVVARDAEGNTMATANDVVEIP